MSKTFAGIMQQILTNSMAEGINYEFKIPTAPVIREPGHKYTVQEKALNTHLLKEQMAAAGRIRPQRVIERVQPQREPIRNFDQPHCLRLVETRPPRLAVYYPEAEERHRQAFERQQQETLASMKSSGVFKRSTPTEKISVDLTNGEVVLVKATAPGGWHIVDYFYKNMIRSDSEHKAANNLSMRGAMKELTYRTTNRQRTLKQIQVDLNEIAKSIRKMRFIERFLSGETRHDIAKAEGITHSHVMNVLEDGVRLLKNHYKDEIMFFEAYGEQEHDMADYPNTVAFLWPSGGKQILDNKNVLLVFARRYYDEYLRPTQQQLVKEEGAINV